MLKHVGPYRSTSSLARASTNSLIRGLEDSSSRSSSFSRCPAVNSASLEPTTSNSAISIQSKNSPLSATVATILSSNASKLFDPEETDAESETTQEEGYCGSSPECLRRSLSSPESCSSDYGSPEICKKHIRSSSLDKSDTGFRESCREEDLGSPESYKKSLLSSECVSDDSSSPELTKRREVSRPSTLPRRGAHKSMDGLATLKGGHQVLRKSFRSADSCSLHSTHSFSSLANGKLCSRSSSTSSLTDQAMTPVKVYLRFMRPDIEYKTLSLSSATTCRQLIVMLLAKFRLRHRDPNLFFVTMEVLVRGPGGAAPARQVLVLDDHARPAELQQCRPRGDARFSVGVRRGGLLRVHDSILMPGSQYKSLLVSYRTSSEELVQLLLNCYNNKENPNHYAIHEVVKNPYSDRPLPPDEFPLRIQSAWPRQTRQNYSFVLRRNLSYAFSLKSRVSWRRSLDQSSTDTESEHEDQSLALSSAIPNTTSDTTILSNSVRDSFTVAPAETATVISSSSFSPSTSRVLCDSGFSSPCSSSSRSSTTSSGSPSPPSSPSLSSTSSFSSSSSNTPLIRGPKYSTEGLTQMPSKIVDSSTSLCHNAQVDSSSDGPLIVDVSSKHDTSEEMTSLISILQLPTSTSTPTSSQSLITLSTVTVSASCITPEEPVSITGSQINRESSNFSSSSLIISSSSSSSSSSFSSSCSTSPSDSFASPIPTSSCVSSTPSASSATSESSPFTSPSATSTPLQRTIITIPPSGPSVVTSNMVPVTPTSSVPSADVSQSSTPSRKMPNNITKNTEIFSLTNSCVGLSDASTVPSKISNTSSSLTVISNTSPPPPETSNTSSFSTEISNTLSPTGPLHPPSSPPLVIPNVSPSPTGMKELCAAVESLRTLTIRCPNYDNCFYI